MKLFVSLCVAFIFVGRFAALAVTVEPPLDVPAPVVTEKKDFSKDSAIKKITAYLNTLSTIQSDFYQASDNGVTARGAFYLARPDASHKDGRFRFEYASAPILLITQGTNLIYFDKELNQVTHIDVDDTPLKFLLEKKVKITPENIISIKEEGGVTALKLKDKGKPEELTLIFDNAPFALKKWIVKDVQNIETTVSLMHPEYGVEIDEKLFTFKRPKKERRRR
ncbi:MAG: LolA family protein [Alphaproteobacteria bacterium]